MHAEVVSTPPPPTALTLTLLCMTGISQCHHHQLKQHSLFCARWGCLNTVTTNFNDTHFSVHDGDVSTPPSPITTTLTFLCMMGMSLHCHHQLQKCSLFCARWGCLNTATTNCNNTHFSVHNGDVSTHLINPLTMRVIGAPQMILQPSVSQHHHHQLQ